MKNLSWLLLILLISCACQSSSGEGNQDVINEQNTNSIPKREGYIYLNIPLELKGNNSIEDKLKIAQGFGFKKDVKAILVTSDNIEIALVCTEMDASKIEFQAAVLNKEGQALGDWMDIIYHGQRASSETTFRFNSNITINHQEIVWQCNFEKESASGNDKGAWTKHLLIGKNGLTEGNVEKEALPDGFVQLDFPFNFEGTNSPNKTLEKLNVVGLEILKMGNPNPKKGLIKTANGTLVAIAASESASMGNYELSFYVVDGSGNMIGEDYSTFIYSATSDGYASASIQIQENNITIRSKEYKGKAMLSEKTTSYKITPNGLVK